MAVTDNSGLCTVMSSLWNYRGPVSLEQRTQLSAWKSHGKVRVSFEPISCNVHPYTATLNYPLERFSLPAHPRKSFDLSSAVQAAVEGSLVDSATQVTGDRTRPARHQRLSPRWRSCHADPKWKQINTSQSTADVLANSEHEAGLKHWCSQSFQGRHFSLYTWPRRH